MKLIVLLAICLPILAFIVIVSLDSIAYARETRRLYPPSKARGGKNASISLPEQRKRQLDDWENRFRLACGEEEYRRTLPPWHDAGIPKESLLYEFYENARKQELHRLSTGATDSQVRR